MDNLLVLFWFMLHHCYRKVLTAQKKTLDRNCNLQENVAIRYVAACWCACCGLFVLLSHAIELLDCILWIVCNAYSCYFEHVKQYGDCSVCIVTWWSVLLVYCEVLDLNHMFFVFSYCDMLRVSVASNYMHLLWPVVYVVGNLCVWLWFAN